MSNTVVRTVVIGIDPSSKKIAATVTVNGAEPTLRIRPLPTGRRDTPRQLFLAGRWFRRLIMEFDPQSNDVYVYIENPFVSPKTIRACLPLARMHGHLMATAYACGVKVVDGVDISRWKSVSIGKGNASKTEIMAWVRKCWPQAAEQVGKDQDKADSAGINVYGQHMVKQIKKIERLKEKNSADQG